MSERRASGKRVAAMAACLMALVCGGMHVQPARAGMYTWVDDEGDRHVVDSREKVPAKYRTKAREVKIEETAPANVAQPTPRGDAERAPSPQPPEREVRRPPQRATTEKHTPVTERSGGSFWDRLRAARVAGSFRAPALRPLLEHVFPGEHLLRLVAIAWLAAFAVRVGHSVRAARAARGLGTFAEDYGRYVRTVVDRPDEPKAAALEPRLPRVHAWVRAAAVGPTTVGISRELAMGRVVDEGRLEVVAASLMRPGVVSAHTLAILRRAEGVHLHVAKRPFTPVGWLETLVFMPRYLVWAVGRESDGGLRVVLSVYWLAWFAWAWAA